MSLVVVGGYGTGMTMRDPHFPVAGETVSGSDYSSGPGGKGSNQAIAAARLGADATLLTAIGPDAAAEDALQLWTKEGVGTEHIVRSSAPTMVGFIVVDPAGENQISIAPGALDHLTAQHVEACRPAIRDADLVVVSMEIPVQAAHAALRAAHESGTPALLNPAPALPLPNEIWGWVDVITPNRSEAAQILGLDENHDLDVATLLGRLREKTPATIVLTLGSEGCAVLADGDPYVVAPHPPHTVVDTTGAGDTFTAALAVALTEGRPLQDAVRFANAAGALAVTVSGVIDALPTRTDLDRALAS